MQQKVVGRQLLGQALMNSVQTANLTSEDVMLEQRSYTMLVTSGKGHESPLQQKQQHKAHHLEHVHI